MKDEKENENGTFILPPLSFIPSHVNGWNDWNE